MGQVRARSRAHHQRADLPPTAWKIAHAIFHSRPQRGTTTTSFFSFFLFRNPRHYVTRLGDLLREPPPPPRPPLPPRASPRRRHPSPRPHSNKPPRAAAVHPAPGATRTRGSLRPRGAWRGGRLDSREHGGKFTRAREDAPPPLPPRGGWGRSCRTSPKPSREHISNLLPAAWNIAEAISAAASSWERPWWPAFQLLDGWCCARAAFRTHWRRGCSEPAAVLNDFVGAAAKAPASSCAGAASRGREPKATRDRRPIHRR